MNSFEMNYHFK